MRRFAYLLIVTVLFFAGCQPTPENEVVVKKNTERMLEAALVSPDEAAVSSGDAFSLRNAYGIPDRYNKELFMADGKLKVNIDAKIEIPDSNALPILRVEAANFEQGFIDEFVAMAFNGGLMYSPPEQVTKSRIVEMIDNAQSKLLQQNLSSDSRAELEGSIRQWQSMLETAPDDAAEEPVTSELQGNKLTVVSKPNGSGARVSVYNDANEDDYIQSEPLYQESGVAYDMYTRQATIEYIKDTEHSFPQIIRGASLMEDVTKLAEGRDTADKCILSVTPYEAKCLAEQFLAEVEIEDMCVDSIWLISSHLPKDILESMVSQGSIESLNDYYENTPETQAYEIRCVRLAEGVKVTSDTFFHSRSSANEDSFRKEWFYEELIITVDDLGVVRMAWCAPLQITEVAVENSSILGFSYVQEIFEKMMMVKYEPQYKADNANAAVYDVVKITLSLQRISEQNSVSSGLLVPVWNFYGFLTTVLPNGSEAKNDAYGLVPLMTINAIDGSVIDPSVGY